MSAAALTLSAGQKTVRQEPADDVVAVQPAKKLPPLTFATHRVPSRKIQRSQPRAQDVAASGPIPFGPPIEAVMTKADSVQLDLRLLPQVDPQTLDRPERPERPAPPVTHTTLPGDFTPAPPVPSVPTRSAPAPAATMNFDGLDYATWHDGHPPDTNGDAGPAYYIQTINTAVGVYQKADGVRVAAFTFNSLMGRGHFGNLCDTDNYGDPVVLYDTFEDRWILTDFAFRLNGNDVVNPPGSFQCFAVSVSGDPVNGGWNFYSINTTGGLGDYPKFGIWPDGLYMMANMFDYLGSGAFQNTRMYAFNKAQMYAGKSTIQVVSFDAPAIEFTILPANARLQAGTPPAGAPNYCAVVWNLTNAVSIYKFHVDWTRISLSSLTGPFDSVTPGCPPISGCWTDPPPTVPSKNGSGLDTLADELMVQNQYVNQGGIESLWMSHTVLGGAASTAAPRYYQVDVTGGTVAANTTQAFTHTPDTTLNRFMPSLAVDRAGNMAIGYSTTSASTFPAINYAGRLAADPINTLPQTEVSLINGTGSQLNIDRWGDYSAMTLDPDGCRFWYTNMYYATTDTSNNFLTRIGSFAFPSCVPVGSGGTLRGTVTAAAGGAPLSGASIAFGSRTTTTDGSGFYTFASVPAGTYPSLTVSKPGFVPQTAATIAITDSGTTTRDFALGVAPASACLTDTTQADLQTGVPTAVDLVASPGNVILTSSQITDQQSTAIITELPFSSTSWFGQTFTAGVSGSLASVDIAMDCGACSGTTPNLTVAIRAVTTPANSSLPTGLDLATATIPGFSTPSPVYFNAAFATPLALTAGTQYAIVVRPVSDPSAGTYQYLIGNSNTYASGRRVSSTDSGASWTAAPNRDIGFKTHIKFNSGNLVSSPKDSNPAAGLTPIWSTISWTGTTPANTSLQFQVAGSNSDSGPFNFVGPDGTSATFFPSGASLSQFYGFRYLEYKALLATTVSGATPTLNDVTLCFDNVACNIPVPTISGGPATACGGSTVTLTSSSATGNQWFLNNAIIPGATASTYAATATGSYTVQVTSGACHATSATRQLTFGTPITVNPSSISDGIAGSAYNATFTTTGGTGSVSLSESGALPAGVQFSSGVLSGTPTAAGTFTISVTGTDANSCTVSRSYTFTIAGAAGTAPANLRATANGTAQVILTWTPVASATGYDVLRNDVGVPIGSPASNGYVDTQGIIPGTTYVYRVRAVGPSFPGTLSAPDIATTIVFTDDPIVIGSTVIKGTHLTELRTAVNAVRAAAGLAAATFTDASPNGLTVKATHIQELRTALTPARSTLGVPAVSYSNAATAGTIVRAIDLVEIRNGVK